MLSSSLQFRIRRNLSSETKATQQIQEKLFNRLLHLKKFGNINLRTILNCFGVINLWLLSIREISFMYITIKFKNSNPINSKSVGSASGFWDCLCLHTSANQLRQQSISSQATQTGYYQFYFSPTIDQTCKQVSSFSQGRCLANLFPFPEHKQEDYSRVTLQNTVSINNPYSLYPLYCLWE